MTRPPCVDSHIDFTAEPTETIKQNEVIWSRIGAAKVCGDCPLRNECLANAEAARIDPRGPVRPFGVLGGRFFDGTGANSEDPLVWEQLSDLYYEGKVDNEIGQRIGRTYHQVRYMRQILDLPRLQGQKPQQPVSHGTPRGADQHRRRDEPACDECRAADRKRRAKYRKQAA